jgi:hypothetical protein
MLHKDCYREGSVTKVAKVAEDNIVGIRYQATTWEDELRRLSAC